MKGIFRTLFMLFCISALGARGGAQNISCFSVRAGLVTGQPGDVVSVPILAAGTEDEIVGMQFALTWDQAALQYVAPQIDYGDKLPYLDNTNFNFSQEGVLRFLWLDLLLQGVSVQPGDTLFSINLMIQPGASGYLPIVLHRQYPGIPLEISTLWDGIIPTGALDGGVLIGNGQADPLSIAEACQSAADCSAPYGAINLTLSGGTPPYTYSWVGPSGPISGSDNFVAAGAGQYAVTVTDQDGATATGAFTLESDVTFLSIYPNEIQQPNCVGQGGVIEVEAISGVPPYEYVWSNGSTGAVQTGLAAGNYTVTVTDASGCTSDASFALHEISGFSLDHILIKPHCGANDGFVSVATAGFSPPFEFLWNTGSTDSFIGNLGAGIYSVTVTNAEGCTESETVWVETDGVNGGWVHNESINCNPLTNLVDIAGIFWTAPGIVPPVQFTWSSGAVQIMDTIDAGGFIFGIDNQPQGQQYVQVSDAGGCMLIVPVSAVCPDADGDSLTVSCLTLRSGQAQPYSLYSNKECVSIQVQGFDDITSLRFGLDWPADKYYFTNLTEIELTPFTPFDLNVFQDQGALLIDWHNPFGQGTTLADGSTLMKVCFIPLANPDADSGLAFTDDFSPEATRNGQPIALAGYDGRFSSATNVPSSTCAVVPDCLNDGNGGFYLDGIWWNTLLDIDLFQHGDLQWSGTVDELGDLAPGTYRADLPGQGGIPQHALLHLPQISTDDCVWPGDADNNAAANHHDLLYLGLAYGASGPSRPAQLLDWMGLDGNTWNQQTDLRKVDFKNIDTNGDGLVSVDDTLAIVQNWGQVINPNTDNPYDAPFGNQSQDLAPVLAAAPDTATSGQVISIPITLGSADIPVDNLHGLAFSIIYDPEMLQNSVYFEPDNSWIGNPQTDLIWLQRNFPDQGRIDIALTRFDGQPANGNGIIGHLFVIIEDDIFFQAPDGSGIAALADADTVMHTTLRFANTQAIGPSEEPIALKTAEFVLPIANGGSTGVYNPESGVSISVWPNPAANWVALSSMSGDIQRVVLVAPDGKVCLDRAMPGLPTGCLDLTGVPAGPYGLKVFTDQGVYLQKLVVNASK